MPIFFGEPPVAPADWMMLRGDSRAELWTVRLFLGFYLPLRDTNDSGCRGAPMDALTNLWSGLPLVAMHEHSGGSLAAPLGWTTQGALKPA